MFTVTWCPLSHWTNSGAASAFEIKSWRHTTLWTAPCKHERTVCTTLAASFYTKQPCNNIQWRKFLTSDMCSAWRFASQTPQVHSVSHVKLAPGWALIWVNFDPIQEIGWKVGGGCSLQDYGITIYQMHMTVLPIVSSIKRPYMQQ